MKVTDKLRNICHDIADGRLVQRQTRKTGNWYYFYPDAEHPLDRYKRQEGVYFNRLFREDMIEVDPAKSNGLWHHFKLTDYAKELLEQ